MHKRGRWAAGGNRLHPEEDEVTLQLRTDSRKAWLFRAQSQGKGGGERKKNDNPERREELEASLFAQVLLISSPASALRFFSSFLPNPPPPLPPPLGWFGLSGFLFFFFKKKLNWKKTPFGALNLRARDLLAGRVRRGGDSDWGGVLPDEVYPARDSEARPPGTTGVGAGPAHPPSSLTRSLPAASLARPLGSSSSHYSLIPIWHPLYAHARHSFFF